MEGRTALAYYCFSGIKPDTTNETVASIFPGKKKTAAPSQSTADKSVAHLVNPVKHNTIFSTDTNMVKHITLPVADSSSVVGCDLLKNMSPAQKDELLFTLLQSVGTLSSSLKDITGTIAEIKSKEETTTQALTDRLAASEAEINIMCTNTGVEFRFWKKLPKEVQIMIWKLAILAPYTHIISWDGASRSPIFNIASSCIQAMDVVTGMNLDYFLVYNDDQRSLFPSTSTVLHIPGTIKNYYNKDIDTFWFTGRNIDTINTPSCVHWVCGKCKVESFLEDAQLACCEGKKCLSSIANNNIMPEPFRIARDLWSWENADIDNPDDFGTVMEIQDQHLKEFYLVIRDEETWQHSPDVVFVKPQLTPEELCAYWERRSDAEESQILRLLKDYLVPKPRNPNGDYFRPDTPWEVVEKRFEGYVAYIADKQEGHRQELINSGQATLEELNTHEDWTYFRDLSYMKDTEIKIVEVRTKEQIKDWIPRVASRK